MADRYKMYGDNYPFTDGFIVFALEFDSIMETKLDILFEQLPPEIHQAIFDYLDLQEISFFAATAKYYLQKYLPYLLSLRDQLLDYPYIKLVANESSLYCYNTYQLFACGDNQYGQLGLGHPFTYYLEKIHAIPGNVLQIALGGFHSLVLTDQGLFACGDNQYGQLGIGHWISRSTMVKVDVEGKVLHIAAGDDFTLVLTEYGLFACGNNRYGQLGLGDFRNRNRLEKVNTEYISGQILEIVLGGFHVFILTDQGLWSSGCNVDGQLGLGDDTNRTTFTNVTLPGKVKHIVAGYDHSIALTDKGIWACGNNKNQLGSNRAKNESFVRMANLPKPFRKLFWLYQYITQLESLKNAKPLSIKRQA